MFVARGRPVTQSPDRVCTVDGKQGVLEIVAGDTGELLSPTLFGCC